MENRSKYDVSSKESIFLNIGGLKISCVIHTPKIKGHFPFVILSHGLFSDKDSPKYIQLAEELENMGIGAVRFDYEGCGESEGKIKYTTISGRLMNLDGVIDFVLKMEQCSGKIGLMGSSLGGYLSLIKAARDPRIIATVVWATPFHLNDLSSKREMTDLNRLGKSFYQDVKRYDLLAELNRVKNCLVIHGKMDEMVPFQHAIFIYEHLLEPKEIHIFPNGNHRLTDNEDRKRATNLTVSWFRRFLL